MALPLMASWFRHPALNLNYFNYQIIIYGPRKNHNGI